MLRLLVTLLLASLLKELVAGADVAVRSYRCEDGKCTLYKGSSPAGDATSQSTCLLTCGGGSIWPYPTGYTAIDEEYSIFYLDKLTVHFGAKGARGEKGSSSPFTLLASSMRAAFLKEVSAMQPTTHSVIVSGEKAPLDVLVDVEDPDTTVMTLHVDESYNLEIARGEVENGIGVRCVITAKTAFGARHGLETLSQLIAFDDIFSSFVIASNVQIMQDRPVFPYRGALIDMSRSFIPLDKLENVVRAMSYNKMNVLHLHISDTTSFPIEIKSQANVTFYGAYSEDKLIRRDQMIDFVKFANSMGVMILPEVDGPAHVGAGFEWGKDAGLGELVVCQDSNGSQKKWINSALEPASGQVNLVNENFYKVMGDVYDEIAEIFSLSDYFHIGGDEIVVGSDEADVSCYNHTEKAVDILAYLESAGYDRRDQESFYALWQNYTYRVASVVEKAFDRQSRPTKKLHIWGGGDIDSGGYSLLNRDDTTTVLPPSMYTIQVWDLSTGSIVPKLIQKGYDVVLSNTDYAYLDCGAAGFTQPGGYWCQPYHEWQHLYEYLADVSNLWGLGADQMTHVLGSETLLWSELIDTNNLEQKMWPRTAALAEALWGRTNTDHSSSWYNADPRMQHWRSVLLQRGIQAEPLQTYWCQQRGAHACTVDTGIPQ